MAEAAGGAVQAMPQAMERLLVEGTGDAVVIADRDGRIRLWNGGAAAMFGYSAAEAIGQSLDLIIPERQRPRHWEGYDRVMASGHTKYGHDLLAVPALRKDGSRISLEFTVTLLHDAAGAVSGIGAIMRDVTARWSKERELHQRLAELERTAVRD